MTIGDYEYCPYCGEGLKAEGDYCRGCGEKVEALDESSDEESSRLVEDLSDEEFKELVREVKSKRS